PEHMRLALYRIYQHAVSNVIRHAAARNLHITFDFDSTQVMLEIRDDGCGFSLPSRWIDLAREGHLGLIGTAERAEAIGGQLNITSAPGKGTTILVTVPLGKNLERSDSNWFLRSQRR
ncbi:MAG: ATPase, partial [Chloroflexi bacterium]